MPSYLERGFPLKSAISKDLQNLMLSGISGMSGKKYVKERKRLEKSLSCENGTPGTGDHPRHSETTTFS